MSDKTFAQKLEELEQITEWFESDKVDLNEALAKFERGMLLAEDLKKELQVVENKVEAIKQKFDTAPPASTSQTDEPDLFSVNNP